MKKVLILLPLLLRAQDSIPENRGAAGLYQQLLQLQTTARAMHIAAHPDDEDGGAITMLARRHGVDMSMLILNRGESGANLVTNDFFDELGALRTVEVLRSAQYYGARVFFTRFIDYGYSKNVGETFRQWRRDDVLRDMVRIIRKEKPHILISKWSGTARDGHGNHEAAGILAQEAFTAAGDPNRFPELNSEGLPPWQPSKLYVGNRNPIDGYTLRVESGTQDPVLGRSYAQIAREGLRFQRSQGTGSAVPRPGPFYTYYRLADSRVGTPEKEQSFLENLDASLRRYPTLEAPVRAAVAAFDIAHPEACAPHLAKALAAVRALPGNKDLEVKERQLQEALAQSLGLHVEARVDPRTPASGPFAAFRPAETFSIAVPGQKFQATVKLHGGEAAKLELLAGPGNQITQGEPGRFTVRVPEDARYTKAYWHRKSISEPSYQLEGNFAQPLPDPPVRARVTFVVDGVQAAIETTLKTSTVDPTAIEHLHDLAVGPPVALRFATEAGILPLTKDRYEVPVTVSNNVDGPAQASVRLVLPAGWRAEPEQQVVQFQRERESKKLSFSLIALAGRAAGAAPVRAVATYQGKEYAASFEPITYPGLQTIYLSKPAEHTVRTIDVKVRSGLRVGYIMGSGDEVPEALRQLGVPVDLIAPDADFGKYTTILLGIRAYAVRPELAANNARLLEFARNGGTVIVQYNTPEFDRNFGPFPYSMGRNPEEVSEEDAPVQILTPEAAVWKQPNVITAADFGGWVEQRGSKFLTTWDPAYTAMIETHDTGQGPQRGVWVQADTGRGKWIYCALAWYRQLPSAVPGAVRIFANLISQ